MKLSDLEKSILVLIQEFDKGDRDSQFMNLINCDSVLGLSSAQKSYLIARYNGMNNKQIAAALDMNYSTVRSHQHLWKKRELEAKLILILSGFLTDVNSQKTSPAMEQDAEGPEQEERDEKTLLPGFDEKGVIRGFYTKNEVHEQKIHHGSSILIVAQEDENGAMQFLFSVKSVKMLTISSDMNAIGKTYMDTAGGGQLEAQDCPGLKIGDSFPMEGPDFLRIMHACCVREFLEEIHIKTSKELHFKPENIVYLYTDETSRPLISPPNTHNRETSGVFLARLPNGLPQQSILIRDVWEDSIGVLVKRKFPSRFADWEEWCSYQTGKDNVFLMDAAQRVAERLGEDEALRRRMFDTLKNLEPVY